MAMLHRTLVRRELLGVDAAAHGTVVILILIWIWIWIWICVVIVIVMIVMVVHAVQ